MGASADDRLTAGNTAALLTRLGRDTGPDAIITIEDQAEDLAQREGVPFEQALRIVTGADRRPYGSLRS